MREALSAGAAFVRPAHAAAGLALLVAFRLWLSAALPMTGDEAYFAWWGFLPDWGYYDHPPMVGWLLALLVQAGSAEWWLRLPMTLSPFLVAGACWFWITHNRSIGADPDERRTLAFAAAALVLLQPINVFEVLISTDTPLIVFSLFSALAYARAAENRKNSTALWSGLWLAGAALSKYFSVLLGFAYLLHVLALDRSRQGLRRLALVLLPVIPAVALQAWWNSSHCWPNVLFNFVNRHEGYSYNLTSPLLYAAMLAYTLLPYLAWAFWKERREIRSALARQPGTAALTFVLVAPLLVLGVVSLKRVIGLHWVLSFVPLACVLAAATLSAARLRTALRFAAGLAALEAALIVGTAFVPLERFAFSHHYQGLVLTMKPRALLERLAPYRDYEWATESYSASVTLGYNARRYIHVWGGGSSHARQDDLNTDWREYAGGKVAVLRRAEPRLEDFTPYFERVRVEAFTERGARFWLVLGEGFRFEPYRRDVLVPAIERFYPPLPLPGRGCPVREKYGI